MSDTVMKRPIDLRVGDRNDWYEVLQAGRQTSVGFCVSVRYVDGVVGERVFDEPTKHTVPVKHEGTLEGTYPVWNPNAPKDLACEVCFEARQVTRTCCGDRSRPCPHWSDRGGNGA